MHPDGNARKRRARRRMSLFKKQGGRCYWCQCEMVLPPDGKHVKHMPPNTGTIDHLLDKFQPGRSAPNPQREERWVLACLGCNNRRGAETQAAIGTDQLRVRSGYYQRFYKE